MTRSCSSEAAPASWAPPDSIRSVFVARPLERGRAAEGRGLGASRFGERARELRARADRELAVDAREMDLDRPLSDEERLRDLAVGGAFGRQLGDAALTGRQRLDAAQGDTPRARAGGEKLALRTFGERAGAADRRQLESLTKLLARLRAAVGPAKRGAQLGPGLRVLEPSRRPAQDVDRFHEELEPALAALDEACRTQGGAERPRGTPRARELDLFLSKRGGLVPPAELKQSQRGGRAPRDEGGVPAADLLEQTSGLEHLLEAPGQVSTQQAQAPGAVAEEEQARAARRSFAGPRARQNGRGFVEPALLHERVGEEGGRVPREASRRAPDLPCGEGLTRFGLHLAEVATPAQREGAEDLHRTECERRAVPVGLGERVLVDREDLVEIRHREHRARRDEAGADRVRDGRLVRAQDRAVGEGLARERDDLRRRPARTCVVVGEQGEQQLLACGPGSGLDADAFEPLGRMAVEPRGAQAVRDQAGREEALELRIGPGKLVERLLEHGVRLLSAEDEQLAAEQSRGLGAPHRARGQRMRLAQVLYCGLSAHVRLGRAELEEHFGALRVRRRLLEGASKVGDGALRGTARAGAPRGVAQRRDGLRICG